MTPLAFLFAPYKPNFDNATVSATGHGSFQENKGFM